MYLGWYDADKKRSAAEKVREAIARYTEKWGHAPQVVLVNSADFQSAAEVADIEVVSTAHVAPNTFFIGDDA